MTWASLHHPSIRSTTIYSNVKHEPSKKYMFADEVLKNVMLVN